MLKFYHKKETSLEKTPILLRLERRHTLMESSQDSVGKERRASRANSVGSIGGTPSSVSTPVEQTRTPSTVMSDDMQSIFSKASTVVITESELSSSWLYNSKKAQIDSTNETIMDSKSGTTLNSLDNPVPNIRQDPLPKTLPSIRPPRQTSCCCYLTLALFILVASLGILAAIGGIIYMELFSSYMEKSNRSALEQGNSHEIIWKMVNSSTGKAPAKHEVTRESDETLRNEITVPFGVSVEGIKLPEKIESSTALTTKIEHFSDNESNSSTNVRNESELFQVPNENNSIFIHVGKDSIKTDDHGNWSQEGLPDSFTNGESSKEGIRGLSDQDKLDLFVKFNEATKKHFFINENQYPRNQLADQNSAEETEFEQDKDFEEHKLDINLKNSSDSGIDSLSNIGLDPVTNNFLDLNSDGSLPVFQGQLAYLPLDQMMNIDANKQNIPEAEFDHPKENSHHPIDLKTNSFPPASNSNNGKETSEDPVEKDSNTFHLNLTDNVFNNSASEQGISDDTIKNVSNTLRNPKENSHHSIDLKTDSFPPVSNSNDGKETSDDEVETDSNTFHLNRTDGVFNNSASEQGISNDTIKNNSNILHLNRTDGASNTSISEQMTENIAVEQKSLPFEFFQRLGFNEASLTAHPALTVEDMNVKFSLAEALKYLRSLDQSNKLPTSRQKSYIPQNHRSPKKMVDVGKERKEYLTKLRENLFN